MYKYSDKHQQPDDDGKGVVIEITRLHMTDKPSNNRNASCRTVNKQAVDNADVAKFP